MDDVDTVEREKIRMEVLRPTEVTTVILTLWVAVVICLVVTAFEESWLRQVLFTEVFNPCVHESSACISPKRYAHFHFIIEICTMRSIMSLKLDHITPVVLSRSCAQAVDDLNSSDSAGCFFVNYTNEAIMLHFFDLVSHTLK